MLGTFSQFIYLIDRLFQPCKKHHFGIDKAEKLAQSPDDSKFLMKTISQIKSNVGGPIKKKVLCAKLDIQYLTFSVLCILMVP